MSTDPESQAILEARRRFLGSGLSLHYRRPLHIVRGRMQYLYDAGGRAFLDAVNNVAHVGHQHPRVVDAAKRQLEVLNTNTRYLHQALPEYAERLLATLPEPLEVCWFVNSGSEANELALRMARAHTGRGDVMVLEGAYHGNTSSLVEMSPYKYRGRGGQGPTEWVHEAPLPDPYRGQGKAEMGAAGAAGGGTGGDGDTGATGDPGGPADPFVGGLERALDAAAARGRPIGAFFVEPLPGCAGQIVPPPDYLRRAFRLVREAGGVCVADEVQTGFGRVGSRFWAFQGVAKGPAGEEGSEAGTGAVPDIVTLGKPMGNGHPMGAVVATREVADSFATGMEYFNTFGGNPVSMAVGNAVLDVIQGEGLQAHAARVGDALLEGLRALAARHTLIGDVRGMGLYLGVELVLDPDARTPAPDHAAAVAERMRDEGILIGTDGILGNVLKIKPPMPFAPEDGERLVETLDRILGEGPAEAQGTWPAAPAD